MDEALRQTLLLGRGYFEKKQYAQAEQYLVQVVEQNQSFADVYNMLGVVYHDQGQFARAQRAFEAALRINPAYTEAALNLAVIYNDMGKYREAKEVYQARSVAQPLLAQPDGPLREGEDRQHVRRHRRRLRVDRHADRGGGGVPPRAGAGADLRRHPAEAGGRAARRRAARRGAHGVRGDRAHQTPSYLPGRVHYGVALYSAGRVPDAVVVWEDVLRRQPGHKSAEMYLSLVRDIERDARQAAGQDPVGG